MIMSNEKQVWTLPDPANDPSLFINDVEFINKQRIVDVLKGKLDILPNATEGAPYGFHQACIGIAKALGISVEELNRE